MALPMLVGSGAECGPSNPLQGLTKRFDQDRGLQQDHFASSSKAVSSRQVFHTTQSGGPQPFDQDAARFFGGDTPHQQLVSPPPTSAFDFSALHAVLPSHNVQMALPAQQQQHTQAMNWASDFLQQQQQQPSNVTASLPIQSSTVGSPAGLSHATSPWNPPPQIYRMSPMTGLVSPTMTTTQQRPVITDQIAWDREFQSQEQSLAASTFIPDAQPQMAEPATQAVTEPLQQTQSRQPPQDELAHIAGQLLAHVEHEQNPKFAKSHFLGLMKQLRDGEMVVKGNGMVQNDGSATTAPVDVKGKGRAVESSIPVGTGGVQEPSYFPMSYSSRTVFQGQRPLSEAVQEDENDAYFRQENEEYMRYWDNVHSASRQSQDSTTTTTSKATPWDQLQRDWEAFEATTTGIQPVTLYQFQSNNPYLLGDSSTRHHLLHGEPSMYESVLALEAAVQRDMNNANAWYELGVKQQENEREQKALQALKRAVELDPAHLPTWLALGVSYTNDGDRNGAYTAIKEWVDHNKDYQAVVRQWRESNPESANASLNERFNALIPCMIAMATSSVNGQVDADVQIALAVLLNTKEDYEKARDCFTTALAVRPDDWLLYNRVGATMANSGHAEEALQYYYRALELNPVYIRARYNLGISCINLRRYEEAAGHILDALALQDNDGVKDPQGLNEKRGVTSTALWDSLKTACLHMQRVDWATLCDHQDLDGFRSSFHA